MAQSSMLYFNLDTFGFLIRSINILPENIMSFTDYFDNPNLIKFL